MTEVRAYVCDFCPRKKRLASASGAKRHEARCFYNPSRRACATCQHFSFDREEGVTICAEGLLPWGGGPEDPEQRFRNQCVSWQARDQAGEL